MHDPELLIRTGGERRLSNYLLWQVAESELVFSDELWPDFSRDSLEWAIRLFGESASEATGPEGEKRLSAQLLGLASGIRARWRQGKAAAGRDAADLGCTNQPRSKVPKK